MRVSAGLAVTTLSGKMRIHTFPPRFIWWVIARRAASIWRLSTHAGSSACRPNSPKATCAPRVACPARLPRCARRYFMRFGISMARTPLYSLGLGLLATGVTHAGAGGTGCLPDSGILAPVAGGCTCTGRRTGAAGSTGSTGSTRTEVTAWTRPARPATRTARAARAAGATPIPSTATAALLERRLHDAPAGTHVPAVDPALHADPAVRRVRLGLAVVDIGT